MLGQLALDGGDECLPLLVHFILRLEERAALLVALGFEGFDLFLADKLFLQSGRGGGSSAGFLDQPVHLLDLAFEAELEVVRPAVEFLSRSLEEPRVAFGNHALDRGLSFLDGDLGRARGDAQAGAGDFSRQGEQARGAFVVERGAGLQAASVWKIASTK